MIEQIWQNHSAPLRLEPYTKQVRLTHVLSGGLRQFGRSEYGTVLLQQYDAGNFSINHIIINALKSVTYTFKASPARFHLLTPIKNHLKMATGGQKQKLSPGIFSMMPLGRHEFELNCKKRQEYRLFYIGFSSELINGFPPYTSASFLSRQQPVSAKMSDTLSELVNSSYHDQMLWLFYEIKIKELVLEIAAGNSLRLNHEKLNPFEIQAIQSLDYEMRYNSSEYTSLLAMAQKAGISQYKLKLGFKELLGTGIFERLLYWRIEMACRLLTETNKPVKEIASLVGYKRITSFITFFRKRTGYTPGEYRMLSPLSRSI